MNMQRGYSLIELAVVILIIGILLAGLAIPLSSQVRTARVQQAQAELERIQDALIGYAIADPNRRLPCPDTNSDGQGDNLCDDVEGDLPWADLGVGRRDPWGNPYRYRANNAYTAATGVPDPPDTAGTLSVENFARSQILTVGNPNGPAAMVFSLGPNQVADRDNLRGAPSPNSNDVYTQDLTNDNFDDILVILSKNVFINRLVQSRKWPP